ncbi:MAG: TniQ family protein [Pseudomonadota bacterium]
MSGLALRVEPSECEPATSWASRLAEKNGCAAVQDLIHDMGRSWTAFRTGDQSTIATLCDLTRVDAKKLLKFTYRSGNLATSKWIVDEWIAPKLMRFDTLSVCPCCIVEAKSEGDGCLKTGAPVWWYLEGVRLCPIHNRTLFRLPPPERGRCKHDYAGRVRDSGKQINSAWEREDRLSAGPFEHYVINRLKYGASQSPRWVDNLDLATVIRASEQLGLVALGFGETIADERILINAASKGFDALSGGPKRLAKELAGLQPARSKGSFYADFFPFSQCIDRIQHRPGCAPLREVVHKFVVNNYPCAAGEVVFGQRVDHRQVHSISSAAEKAKVAFPRMRKVLYAAHKGRALKNLARPNRNLWVKTADWDAWLDDFGRAITLKPAARQLGVCSSTFSRLVSSGLLKPLASVPETAPRYSVFEIENLVMAVTKDAMPLTEIPLGMVKIGSVQSSCKTSISALLWLLLDKRLKTVGRLEDHAGISGICVAKEELLDELEGPPLPGLGSGELRKHLRINFLTIPWLVSKGFLTPKKALHPRTRKSVQLFRYDEINKFLAEYETIGRLSHRLTKRSSHLVKQLKQEGIEPMAVERNMSVIYRRSDLPDSLL